MGSMTLGLFMMLTLFTAIHSEYEELEYTTGENYMEDYYYSEEHTEVKNNHGGKHSDWDKNYFYEDEYYDDNVDEDIAESNTKGNHKDKKYFYNKGENKRKKLNSMTMKGKTPRRNTKARWHVEQEKQRYSNEDYHFENEYFHREKNNNHHYNKKDEYESENYYFDDVHYQRNTLRTNPRKPAAFNNPNKARLQTKHMGPICNNKVNLYTEQDFDSENEYSIHADDTETWYFNTDCHICKGYHPRKKLPMKDLNPRRVNVYPDKRKLHMEPQRRARRNEGFHLYYNGGIGTSINEANTKRDYFNDDYLYKERYSPRHKIDTMLLEENLPTRNKAYPDNKRSHVKQTRQTRSTQDYHYDNEYYPGEYASDVHVDNIKQDYFNKDYHYNDDNYSRERLTAMPMKGFIYNEAYYEGDNESSTCQDTTNKTYSDEEVYNKEMSLSTKNLKTTLMDKRIPKEILLLPDKGSSQMKLVRPKRGNDAYYYDNEEYDDNFHTNNSDDDSNKKYRNEDYYYDNEEYDDNFHTNSSDDVSNKNYNNEDYYYDNDYDNERTVSNDQDKNTSEDYDNREYFENEEYYDEDPVGNINENNTKELTQELNIPKSRKMSS